MKLIEEVGLISLVEEKGGIDKFILKSKSDMSVGEKQLFCMLR